ncbi:hypothetical protein AVEN_82113-1 [Araneus ventricosus]|uniref:Uncharacterized protein n=1 Tax=Araneus ventricosus TaxID=182803 RepID=A0A4Y2I3X0_ARAVE|nr:hypothetical protein AVEN_82113-1 [Araneus ventricosus]
MYKTNIIHKICITQDEVARVKSKVQTGINGSLTLLKSLFSQGLAIGFHELGARTSTESQAETSDKNRSRESRFGSDSHSEFNLVSSYSSQVSDLPVPLSSPNSNLKIPLTMSSEAWPKVKSP